jgi:hypothetical protein
MSALNRVARERIKASGLTIARYVRYHFPSGRWGGDACGCADDRCKDGFHHYPDEECGCLPVLIEQVFRGEP